MSDPVLSIRDLVVRYHGVTPARTLIDNVSLDVGKGEILGLVGESGSGKSLLCRSVIGLLPSRALKIDAGSVMLDGQDLTGIDRAQMLKVRGRKIGMIFQNPSSHLDPVMKIGEQVAEVLSQQRGEERCPSFTDVAHGV